MKRLILVLASLIVFSVPASACDLLGRLSLRSNGLGLPRLNLRVDVGRLRMFDRRRERVERIEVMPKEVVPEKPKGAKP